jgi:hypothetical protein
MTIKIEISNRKNKYDFEFRNGGRRVLTYQLRKQCFSGM